MVKVVFSKRAWLVFVSDSSLIYSQAGGFAAVWVAASGTGSVDESLEMPGVRQGCGWCLLRPVRLPNAREFPSNDQWVLRNGTGSAAQASQRKVYKTVFI